MNLVPTHSNCTSPMDYISHHALHSHIPVHHYTNHTAVTIHSSLWLPHHTCTSFSHSHKSSTQTLTQCEVLFSPGYISERSPIHPAISVFDPGLPDLGTLNLCLWPRPLPGIVYVSALPLIFLLCPLTIACVILPLSNKHILLHLDPLPLTSLYTWYNTALAMWCASVWVQWNTVWQKSSKPRMNQIKWHGYFRKRMYN